MIIVNPKQVHWKLHARDDWFRYYAGFSTHFATTLLSSSGLKDGAQILDPWNGAGTTTVTAKTLGLRAIGVDINPVMVIAAKARCISCSELAMAHVTVNNIVNRALSQKHVEESSDPLCIWLTPKCASTVRRLQHAIKCELDSKVSQDDIRIGKIDDAMSFYYIALFKLVREMVKVFKTSNPTWIKRSSGLDVVHVADDKVIDLFKNTITYMVNSVEFCSNNTYIEPNIFVASSTKLPIQNEAVDFVVSSPPYCTRIDYAIATIVELAVLGYKQDNEFDSFRRSLIGASTVPSVAPEPIEAWGMTCNNFLSRMKKHPSKASSTYYFKNHTQYFQSIFTSISEISRVLKSNGKCVLVVQDSYYKDIHNDLPAIFVEMMSHFNLKCEAKESFYAGSLMARMHPHSRKYRTNSRASESVLCFVK